jgi:probable blue pigment (indigoidine) exporter
MKSTPRSPALTAGLTLLAPVAWGSTYVTVTELLPAGRPLLVAAARVLPAGLLLVLVGRRRSTWRPTGREWGRTGLLAICNFGLFLPLLVGAVYRLPGGVAAAAGGTQPILVAAFSWAVVGRRPGAAELVVGMVAAFGVALVVVRPGAGLDAVGVAMALAANTSFALGVVLTKRFPPPVDRLAATGWQLAMAGVALLALALVVEGAPPSPTASNLLGVGYLSIVATAAAYVLWFDGIRTLPVPAPPLLGLAAPVTGAVLGWLVLGQALAPLQLLGFAITIAAIGRGATLRPASGPDRSGGVRPSGPVVAAHPTRTRGSCDIDSVAGGGSAVFAGCAGAGMAAWSATATTVGCSIDDGCSRPGPADFGPVGERS